MVYTKAGRPLDLASIVEFEGGTYHVHDISGDIVIAVSTENNRYRRRLTATQLGMTSDMGDEKRKAIIKAKLRLREYWED
jgi:KaiC/GvpD/RAD55 family RecA-like ATPase|tara:strand:- start:1197 stop:1436 length:240 start_codon:yes stop_codon:yes gene_type:complete